MRVEWQLHAARSRGKADHEGIRLSLTAVHFHTNNVAANVQALYCILY